MATTKNTRNTKPGVNDGYSSGRSFGSSQTRWDNIANSVGRTLAAGGQVFPTASSPAIIPGPTQVTTPVNRARNTAPPVDRQVNASDALSIGGAAASPAPPQLSDDEWLASGSDSQFGLEMDAITKALQRFMADRDASVTNYNTDFNSGLKQLGWMGGQKAEGTGDVGLTEVGEDGSRRLRGGINPSQVWNRDDVNTASGRAMSGQMNDFASRGMLQSSDFGNQQNALLRSLTDQLIAMDAGRGDFLRDDSSTRANYKDENTAAQTNARTNAIMRRASGLSSL